MESPSLLMSASRVWLVLQIPSYFVGKQKRIGMGYVQI